MENVNGFYYKHQLFSFKTITKFLIMCLGFIILTLFAHVQM